MKRASSSKLQQLISWVKGIDVAMLTTEDRNGNLRSRPMVALADFAEDAIWFFTEASSHKVDDVQGHHAVNISYSDGERGRYVSVAGRARVIRDKAKLQALWEPRLQAWFPKGASGGDLALLRIEVREAELWQMPERAIQVAVAVESGEAKAHEMLTFA